MFRRSRFEWLASIRPPRRVARRSIVGQFSFQRRLQVEPLEERCLLALDLNFAGQGYSGVHPPDTVGDVGLSHYVQATNDDVSSNITIYNKIDGSVAVPQFHLSALAAGATGSSPYTGLGDPIVLYDHLADRWLLMEFENTGNELDIFISDSGTPTGNGADWTQYRVNATNFPDYPKITLWPDAYFIGTNEPDNPVYALNRSAMLSGSGGLITAIRRTTTDRPNWPFDHTMPVHLDGSTPPPANAPGMFVRQVDDELTNPGGANPSFDFLELWAFDPDFVTPANSTYGLAQSIPIADFALIDLSFDDLPQPGTSQRIDALDDVFMWRPQYRNFGTHETLVGNFAVDDASTGVDQSGVRWFELRRSGGGSWTLYQEGTFAPDATHRFNGAIAMDGAGNIALGYNVTSSSVFPGIRYAGRLAGDPLGTLPRGEYSLIDGLGSQTSSNRFGDYAAMSVDPVDDSTFWFTSEYILAGGSWATRIAAFDMQEIVGIDLLGASFDVTPDNLLAAGGLISTGFAVHNQGDTAAGAFDVKFYLSDDVTIDPDSDILLTLAPSDPAYDALEPSAYHVLGLASLGILSTSVTLAVPSTDPFGTDNNYYVGMFVDADGDVPEADETGNRNRGQGLDRDDVFYSLAIDIPSIGAATPYPSNITVSGQSGTITDVNVSLLGLTHTFPDDVDILLVGPAGQKMILLSDVGGSADISGVNLILDDAAGSSLPNSSQLTSGTFRPTNFGPGDTFPLPAPAGPYASTLATFDGTNPNGTWSLYVVDDEAQDSGSISGGWTLTITTTGNVEQEITINLGLILNQGTTAAITAAILETTDVDNVPADLLYTISSGPAYGTVLLSGTPATQFTQQDINNGVVSYEHDGSENFVDSFDFSVDDGVGVASPGVFSISILPPAGDYNRDGSVDAADYVIWRKALGTDVPIYTGADGSGDGIVGPEDYDVYAAHFGATYPGTGSGRQVGRVEQGARSDERGARQLRRPEGAWDFGLTSTSSDFQVLSRVVEPRIDEGNGEQMGKGEGGGGKAKLHSRLDAAVASAVASFRQARSSDADSAGSPRLPAVLADSGKRDAALADWVASRSRDDDVGAADVIETFGRRGSAENSRESLFGALDFAFEELSAEAA